MTGETFQPATVAQDQVREQARRMLADTSYDWLRSLGRRRALVGLSLASVVGVVAACLVDRAVVVALALAMAIGFLVLLRATVRGMADLPGEVLDERMRTVRNEHYQVAYTVLSTVTVLVLITLYIAADARRIAWQLTANHLQGFFWGFTLLALMLPSMLVAWNEPDI